MSQPMPVVVKVHASMQCAEQEQRTLPPGTISKIVPRTLAYLGIQVKVFLLAHQVVPELKPEPGRLHNMHHV